MRTTKIEHLPCQMTGKEQLLKSAALAKAIGELSDLEAEKKEFADDWKDRKNKVDGAIKILAGEVRTGKEVRPIECFESPVYSDMMVELIRSDTGEIVSSRPMHPSERQLALDEQRETEKPQKRGKAAKAEAEAEPVEAVEEEAH